MRLNYGFTAGVGSVLENSHSIIPPANYASDMTVVSVDISIANTAFFISSDYLEKLAQIADAGLEQ